MKKMFFCFLFMITFHVYLIPVFADELKLGDTYIDLDSEIDGLSMEEQLEELEQFKASASTVADTARDITVVDKEVIIKNAQYVWKEANNKQKEIERKIIESNKINYTAEDLDMLSRVMNGEAGSSWLRKDHPLAVGNVILNRVKDPRFPNTIKEVIYAPGQYSCVRDGNYDKPVPQRIISDAKRLLEGYRMLPDNVVWQAQFKQGKGVYEKIDDHYFCY